MVDPGMVGENSLSSGEFEKRLGGKGTRLTTSGGVTGAVFVKRKLDLLGKVDTVGGV